MGRRPSTFYFYDLETSGIRPRSDRLMQFAGLRTDAGLQPVGEPVCIDVALGDEVVPNPESILVTGITPQRTRAQGVSEWRAISDIEAEFCVPGTCVLGYNSLRFDDEFVRHTLYRNLLDPYAREWRDGNSRWDLVDLVRAAGALRPDGIEWPRQDDKPSFRLENMAAANGLTHDSAHDALSDVRATVELAQLIQSAQPKLFDYYLLRCGKVDLRRHLLPLGANLLVHVTGMIANDRDCCAPVMSVAEHPHNANSVIVVDLGGELGDLLGRSADELRENLFTADADNRPPLKEIRLNRCPFVAPLAVVRAEDEARLGWDVAALRDRWREVQQHLPTLSAVVADVYRRRDELSAVDPDEALYDGFIGDRDRAVAQTLQQTLRARLAAAAATDDGPVWPADLAFEDPRLQVLASRLKARLLPQELDAGEHEAWARYVSERLQHGPVPLAAYRDTVQALLAEVTDARQQKLLNELAAYGDELDRRLSTSQRIAVS